MNLLARVSGDVGSGEAGPKLSLLRDRLLNRESASADGTPRVGLGETTTKSLPDYSTEENQDNTIKTDSTGANSEFQVSSSVDRPLGSVRAPQEREVTELATSLESLEPMEHSAAAILEPIKALCERMRNLPYTFAPLRAFEQQLGELAESFAPMEALHQQVVLMVEDSGAPLVQLAKSLDVLSVSRKRIARLASTLETAAELQVEFNELVQSFNPTSPRTLKIVRSAA
jgi:hypothetical protein